MPLVLPFRAVRPTVNGEALALRLSPPYDVIAPEERERLARDPHNPVHVILPEERSGPGSRYEDAGRRFGSWLAEGALERDPMPAFYPYEQRFEHAGEERTRTGFFGLLELRRFDEGGVFAHERTLTVPKEDRFRLLRATGANLSPVFVLYEDADRRVGEVVERARRTPPRASAATASAIESLWAIPSSGGEDDTGTIADTGRIADTGTIADTLARQSLVVADGHHRYESALRYRDERRAADPDAAYPQAFDFMLACFVEARDPGLIILPTHRLLANVTPRTGAELEADLAGVFVRHDLGPIEDPESAVLRAERFLSGPPRGAFVYATAIDSSLSGFALAPGVSDRAFRGSETAPALRALDVVVLHELVLERVFGITPEKLAAQTHVEYVKSGAEAIRAALGMGPDKDATRASSETRASGASGASGSTTASEARAAFLLAATPVEQVLAVARAGERMPQKSTYFVPKITTGWIYHVHGSPAEVWGENAGRSSWWPSGAPTA